MFIFQLYIFLNKPMTPSPLSKIERATFLHVLIVLGVICNAVSAVLSFCSKQYIYIYIYLFWVYLYFSDISWYTTE